MNFSKIIVFSLFSAFLFEAAAVPGMPDSRGACKPQAQQEYKGGIVFDPASLTYNYGSKKIVFDRDGTFLIYSSGKKICRFSFIIQTPYKTWCSNNGRNREIRVTRITPKGNELVFDGLVPWNKPKEPARNFPWQFRIKPMDRSRIFFDLKYTVPPDLTNHRHDKGSFFELYEIKNLECAGQVWFPGKKYDKRWVPDVISVNGFTEQNLLKFDFVNAHNWTSKAIRVDFNKDFQNKFILDLGKSFAETKNPAGGVDFLRDHALQIPERGKNLMLNPYFAQGLQYINYFSYRGCGAYHYDLSTENPKFGKYCLGFPANQPSVGYISFSPVPASPGKYIFSFYARGNSSLLLWRGDSQFDKPGLAKRWKSIRVNSPDWKRYEFPIEVKTNDVISIRMEALRHGLYLDGFQLEKGTKATAFEAPEVTARMTAQRVDSVFNRGENVILNFELSTLEPSVKGTASYKIRNFYGETEKAGRFSFDFKAGTYPVTRLKLGKNMPDGFYVVELDYTLQNGKQSKEFFRFSVMPFKDNTHKTARLYSHSYYGGEYPRFYDIKHQEYILKQSSRIGYGSLGHSSPMFPENLKLFKKYNVLSFDIGFTTRTDSAAIKKVFPNLNPPPGHIWFYVVDPSGHPYNNPKGLIADYRLMGGWNENWKKDFQRIIANEVRKYPQAFSYRFGSEWANEIKNDPHYPDLVMAYAEAVRSVYPDAKVYEAGDTNMEIRIGNANVEKFLKRIRGKWKPAFVATHTYTMDMPQLYHNFRHFIRIADENGCKDVPLAFPEGGHYWAYAIPEWNCQQIHWTRNCFVAGPLSYDLGWTERLSAAYYARGYLVFLTEFKRSWCCTLAAKLDVDVSGTPTPTQKAVNTLVDLLGSPRRFLGNCTFAPDTMCLVWEDEQGRPVAAVWNEEQSVNAGLKDAPMAELDYKGAEFIDLMGNPRKLSADGTFPVSPFPMFIRGRKGDCANFVKAISTAVLNDPDKLPCRFGFEVASANQVRLIVNNPLARRIQGSFKVFNKQYTLDVAGNSQQSFMLDLPKTLRNSEFNRITIPYSCTLRGHTIHDDYSLVCFNVPRFKGDWSKIPEIPLTNRIGKKGITDTDYSAKFQAAWDPKKLYVRITVRDDVFTPGSVKGFRYMYDAAQIYFDTRCSALKKGLTRYDEDDYSYCLQPTADGKHCEVWRERSPDIQLTLGTSAPKDNTLATEIPAKFTRTKDGYIYEAEFPADYLLPIRLNAGYNFGFGIYLADRDKEDKASHGLSNTTEPGRSCHNNPHLWPVAVLTE